MTKENTIFRTHEIKTNILRILETPMEILSFHIRDGNLHKFRDTFERHKIVVDCTDKNSNSLINLAVQCGNYEIVSYLINLGADVNLQNVN
jgi:ankyrin repeat protein